MVIYDKHNRRDYYDSIQSYGQDLTCPYYRNEHQTQIKITSETAHLKCGNCWFIERNLKYSFKYMLLFCGKVIPILFLDGSYIYSVEQFTKHTGKRGCRRLASDNRLDATVFF